MKLINKLKKAYPRLKKGMDKKYDSCIIGVTADELKLVYDRDMLANKVIELGIVEGDTEAEEYVYWYLSCGTDYTIINNYYQGEV